MKRTPIKKGANKKNASAISGRFVFISGGSIPTESGKDFEKAIKILKSIKISSDERNEFLRLKV